jgi:hypothetical protein
MKKVKLIITSNIIISLFKTANYKLYKYSLHIKLKKNFSVTIVMNKFAANQLVYLENY